MFLFLVFMFKKFDEKPFFQSYVCFIEKVTSLPGYTEQHTCTIKYIKHKSRIKYFSLTQSNSPVATPYLGETPPEMS